MLLNISVSRTQLLKEYENAKVISIFKYEKRQIVSYYRPVVVPGTVVKLPEK